MSVRDYGIAAPHGPNMTDQHVATEDAFNSIDMTEKESDVFRSILKPSDMYDENGEYWGDMSIGKRIGFVSKVDREEAKKELGTIGSMMKADPLSPIGWYFRNMVIPGAGLGLEGYVAFGSSAWRTTVVLTPAQIRSVLHWQRQAAFPKGLP
jgi:hypothetical protein